MERLDAAIIGHSVYREWCTVLSAVGKAELGWVSPNSRAFLPAFTDIEKGSQLVPLGHRQLWS